MSYDNRWYNCKEKMPKEEICVDEETGYYYRSYYVLCFALDDYNNPEYWIDYTVDGMFVKHGEICNEDNIFWQELTVPKEYTCF